MISKLELEYIKECLLASMGELDNLADELEWFVSDTVEGLAEVYAIMEREEKESGS